MQKHTTQNGLTKHREERFPVGRFVLSLAADITFQRWPCVCACVMMSGSSLGYRPTGWRGCLCLARHVVTMTRVSLHCSRESIHNACQCLVITAHSSIFISLHQATTTTSQTSYTLSNTTHKLHSGINLATKCNLS